jgi:hypothetical protein
MIYVSRNILKLSTGAEALFQAQILPPEGGAKYNPPDQHRDFIPNELAHFFQLHCPHLDKGKDQNTIPNPDHQKCTCTSKFEKCFDCFQKFLLKLSSWIQVPNISLYLPRNSSFNSSRFFPTSGVPQGSLLRPAIFPLVLLVFFFFVVAFPLSPYWSIRYLVVGLFFPLIF